MTRTTPFRSDHKSPITNHKSFRDSIPPSMAAPSTELPAEVVLLVEQKNFDAVEDVWTRRMEEEPDNLPFFFSVASAVKKKGGGAAAVSCLRFLADYEAERGDPDQKIAELAEISRMS